MAATLGYGKRRLIGEIIKNTWGKDVDLANFKFSVNDILYIMQEMAEEEGKKHLTNTSILRGHHVFRKFAEHLLYRNLANYDSMVLMTSEKGCVTDDCLIKTEDYPNGIAIKHLINKGPLKVYSYNKKTHKLEIKQSDGVMFAKYDDICELTLQSGYKIKATLDHPVVLEDGSKKQIQNLCYDDNILYVEDNIIKISQKIRIKTLGKQNVYDVVNVKDNHNFICNSVVVTNTGKSSAAVMLGRQWCKLIGIRFDPKKHMAYSNKDMMEKIDNADNFSVLIADESVRFACVKSNTIIQTKSGNFKIKDLVNKKNFEVLSWNKSKHKSEWKQAEKCIKTKTDYVYEIETICGKKISATKEHLFLLKNGDWKRLDKLKEGDDLVDI